MIYDYVQAVDNDRDVRLPKIVEYADPATVARFNADVERRLKDYACDSTRVTTNRHRHYWFKAQAEVTLASDDFLSYRVSFDYFCGGPYPSRFDSGVTWDLRKGAPVRFFEAFKSADDRRGLLAAALGGRGVRGCDTQRLAHDNDPLEFVLTPGGLELWPDLARVPNACKMRLKMGFGPAEPFLAPASPLRRLVDKPR